MSDETVLEEKSENFLGVKPLEATEATAEVEAKAPEQAPQAQSEEVEEQTRWYVVHTYSGFEQRVKKTVDQLIRSNRSHGEIVDCIVPTERVVELSKSGTKRTTTRKFYPGYILVKMIMSEASWNLIQEIPKVTGFVGGKNRPTPMKPSEAQHILSLMETRQEATPRPKFNIVQGDTVRIEDGPFGGFHGVVDEVNYDKGKLRVSVSIFGRQTPVELDFVQVSKG